MTQSLRRRTALALPAALLAPRSARSQSAVSILVRFPNGTFLENLVVEPDGRVIFTNYSARRLEAWSPGTGAVTFAAIPAHPVSLTPLGEGRHALAVHGASFMDGPAAMRGQAAVLLVARDGTVTRRIALPAVVFPNGGLLLAPGQLLLADSALGRVWRVDLESGATSVWLDHAALAPNPAAPYPGVNGLKRAGDVLLLSNTATRQLLRVRIDGVAAGGAPELVALMPGFIDDFAVAADGTVYSATHDDGLGRLARGDATPSTFAAPGVEGSTAVALTPDGRSLYALGTGGLLAGGRGEAVLARVGIPVA